VAVADSSSASARRMTDDRRVLDALERAVAGAKDAHAVEVMAKTMMYDVVLERGATGGRRASKSVGSVVVIR